LCLLALVLFAFHSIFAETTILVPMKTERWLSNGNAAFTVGAHAPDGVLEISKGSVDVKDFVEA